jgi:transposase-like protein
MSRKTGKHHGREFKEKAILLGEEIGCASAASKLGISAGLLYLWIRTNTKGNLMKKQSVEARDALQAEREIRKLKRENEELKKANLILRELAKVFSKDPHDTSSRRSLNSTKKSNQR